MNTPLHTKNRLLALLMLVTAMLLPQWGWAQTATQPKTGDGSADKPYEIATAAELAWFRDYVNAGNTSACAKLTDHIDLKDFCHAAATGVEELSWAPIGTDAKPYKGNFDGNGKTISNLYIKAEQNNVGFFGEIYVSISENETKTIKNITFDKAIVESNGDYTGILAGCCINYCLIEGIKTTQSCKVSGKYYTGGIVGQFNNAESDIINCENNASVNGTSSVAGIAGLFTNGSHSVVKDCANYGTVKANDAMAGGIVGYGYGANIQNCANYGTINAELHPGGIIGKSYKSYEGNFWQNVLSYGNVSGTVSVGIIVGFTDGTTLKGIIAYNSEALLNGSSDNIKTAGDGTLAFEDGYSEADVVKGFTKKQMASGEVTYLLNGSRSAPAEGSTLAWYQKLGVDGDAYPVLTSTGDNTVYKSVYTASDGKTTVVYSNTKGIHTPHDYQLATNPDADGLYSSVCSVCSAVEEGVKYIKNFCGEKGNNLRLTVEDGAYKAGTVTLADKTAYNSPVDFTATTLNYSRTFSSEDWQPVYVPFAIDCSQLPDGYEMAILNNFHEYEQKDGSYKVVLEVKRVTTGGTIPALTPCLIRMKPAPETAATLTLNFSDALLSAAADKSIDCSSVTRYYQFFGTIGGKTGFDESRDFAMFSGQLRKAGTDTELSAQRWYLTATDRTASLTAPAVQLSSIAIKVIGDGEATGIDDLHVTTDSDKADGLSQGIYDLQGRKLDKEPRRGVYIMNGRKYVR